MKPLEFKCPSCGCAFIGEVSTEVTGYNEIEVLLDGELRYGKEELVHEGGRTHYECRGCPYRLEGACDGSSLVEWITRYCTFSVETIREKLDVTGQQALNIRTILFDLEPLQYEGNHFSTACRYLSDAGLTHTPVLSGPHAVMRAISIEVDTSYSLPTIHWLWYVAPSVSREKLVYHRRKEYYFWATEKELSEMEAKWIRKNNS